MGAPWSHEREGLQQSSWLPCMWICKVSTPLRPWSLVVAHDEITPGNVLRPDNARKFTSFYFTFAEFGDFAVRHESVWFHVGVLRSTVVKEVIGGLSCALRLLLRAFTMESHGFTDGVLLPLDSGPTLLFAKLRIHLGDEAALSQGLSIKGASGIRPCLKCCNVLKKDSGLAHRRPLDLVEVSCSDTSRFVQNTDRSVWQQYDRLVALDSHSSRAEMDRQQKAVGMNINANGVLADMALRPHVGPVSTMTYDWQHTFLSNGVASQEMFMFLEACRGEGLTNIYSLLEQFCKAEWCFPEQGRTKGNVIHQIFNKAREQASKEHWRSGASELLTAYPLVRRFAV